MPDIVAYLAGTEHCKNHFDASSKPRREQNLFYF